MNLKQIVIPLLAAVALCSGCAAHEQAQQRLIVQMQSGMTDIQQALDSRQKLLDELYANRRTLLDQAFDRAIEQQPQPTAAWFVQQRKGYSAALQAMLRQEQSSQAAHARIQDNLQVLHQGLQKLSWLSEVRENWNTLIEKENSHVRK